MRKLFFANPPFTTYNIPQNGDRNESNESSKHTAIEWQVASSVWPKAHIIVTADNPQQALIQPSYSRNSYHRHCCSCCCCSGSFGTVRNRSEMTFPKKCVRRLISMSRETQMPCSNRDFSSVDLHELVIYHDPLANLLVVFFWVKIAMTPGWKLLGHVLTGPWETSWSWFVAFLTSMRSSVC